MVDVDPLGRDAERGEGVALSGEVLGVGGAAGVADQQSGHRGSLPVMAPSPELFTEPGLRDTSYWADASALAGAGVSR